MLRKMMLVPIVGAVALALSAGPAMAAPNVPKGEPFELAFPAGELCAFPVELEGRSAQRDRLPNSEIDIVTGPAVVTVTNASNGASATFNISGPVKTRGDQTVLTGPSLVLLLASVGPPGPGLLATNGRGTITGGIFDVANFRGRTVDVCAQLATP